MKELFLFILISVLAVVTAFLGVHVILSIATLYSLTFITQFSFIQIWAVWILVGLITYKYKKSEDKSFEEIVSEAFIGLFSTALYYLIAWGFGYLIFNIYN